MAVSRKEPARDPRPDTGTCINRFGLTDAQVTSVSGSVSGFAATFAKQPIQRIKWIRQVDAGAIVPYHEVLRRSIAADGVLGLFRGSVAGIMRNVPHSALVYSIYPQMEAAVLRRQQQQQQQQALPGGPAGGGAASSDAGPSASSGGAAPSKVAFSTRFWAGYATLFIATLITHPLDTCASSPVAAHRPPIALPRPQAVAPWAWPLLASSARLAGSVHALCARVCRLRVRLSVTIGHASTPTLMRQVIETGGVRALYQGFGATLIGAGPRGALGFGVFETLKDGPRHQRSACALRHECTTCALRHECTRVSRQRWLSRHGEGGARLPRDTRTCSRASVWPSVLQCLCALRACIMHHAWGREALCMAEASVRQPLHPEERPRGRTERLT